MGALDKHCPHAVFSARGILDLPFCQLELNDVFELDLWFVFTNKGLRKGLIISWQISLGI